MPASPIYAQLSPRNQWPVGSNEYEMALTTQMATDAGCGGRKLTRESEVGEKSLLWMESQCPTKRCTLRPDCKESLSCRGAGAWVLPDLTWPKTSQALSFLLLWLKLEPEA